MNGLSLASSRPSPARRLWGGALGAGPRRAVEGLAQVISMRKLWLAWPRHIHLAISIFSLPTHITPKIWTELEQWRARMEGG